MTLKKSPRKNQSQGFRPVRWAQSAQKAPKRNRVAPLTELSARLSSSETSCSRASTRSSIGGSYAAIAGIAPTRGPNPIATKRPRCLIFMFPPEMPSNGSAPERRRRRRRPTPGAWFDGSAAPQSSSRVRGSGCTAGDWPFEFLYSKTSTVMTLKKSPRKNQSQGFRPVRWAQSAQKAPKRNRVAPLTELSARLSSSETSCSRASTRSSIGGSYAAIAGIAPTRGPNPIATKRPRCLIFMFPPEMPSNVQEFGGVGRG